METIRLGTLVHILPFGTVIGHKLKDDKVYAQVKVEGASFLYDVLEVPETSIIPVEEPR